MSVDLDLEKLRDLSDEEISERFSKKVIPEIIKKVRQSGVTKDAEGACCQVCNPWTYSVF